MWSTMSLRESIEKLNFKNQKKPICGKWDRGTIFKEKDERQYCVLSISGNQSESDSTVAVLDKSSFCVIFYVLGASLIPKKIHNCKPQNLEIDVLGVKLSRNSKDIYYIATQESITMYDYRMPFQIAETFEADIENRKMKNINCFDINCTERLIAAGTELVGGDAFLLFWDIRYKKRGIHYPLSSKLNFIGAYWESHTDDITSLAFHPSHRSCLASGSTDGLMNVFDLSQSSEDEALSYSLNTESSVDRLGWLTDGSLWCTTHTETLQLWECKDASPYAKFERNDLAISQDEDPDDCYVVKVHTSNTLQPFLLAGCSTDERQYLRCLYLEKNKPWKTCDNLVKNKQVVRDSWLHEKSGTLLTAGEGEFLDVWKLNSTQDKFETTMNVKRSNLIESN